MKNLLSFKFKDADVSFYVDGRFTLAVITALTPAEGGAVLAQAFGQSFCMPTDQFDETTGMITALDRLIRNLHYGWRDAYALYDAFAKELETRESGTDWNNAHNNL